MNEEWQVDEQGRRYRKLGHAIEYAQTVRVDGLELYPDQLREHNRLKREEKERRRKIEQEAIANAPHETCPLMRFKGAIDPVCKASCAFRTGGGCRLAGGIADVDTLGAYCPLNRKCEATCAMYARGCTLLRTKTEGRK